MLGDDLERPPRALGVPRERPGIGRGAPSEALLRARNLNEFRNPNFVRILNMLNQKDDRIFGRSSSTFERILKGRLIIFDSTAMERIFNNCCRTSSKNRERGTWPKYSACQQKQGFGRFRRLSIFDRILIRS